MYNKLMRYVLVNKLAMIKSEYEDAIKSVNDKASEMVAHLLYIKYQGALDDLKSFLN